jgi:hypothetical protein
MQQIFSKDEEALKAAGGQGLGQILGFTWSEVALEDTLFGAYELPVLQKAFQGLSESAVEAAQSGCPDYEAGGWVVLVFQLLWIIFVAFCIYKAVALGYMKFVWFPKSKDDEPTKTQPATGRPAVMSMPPNPITMASPAPMMMHPAGFPGMPGLPVYGMRFGAEDITAADCCEMEEMAGERSVTVTAQNMGQPDLEKMAGQADKMAAGAAAGADKMAAQAQKLKNFVSDPMGNTKGW